MKKTYFILLSAGLLSVASVFAASPEIKLSGRKDRVLTAQVRELVLEVAQESLNREDEAFAASLDQAKTPFPVEKIVVPVAVDPTMNSEEVEVVAPVVYEDASVLEVVAVSFAKQVRGTLARGSVYYLQLQGGGMLSSGTQFPAKIPQVEGETFMVTISEITPRDYTLKLGTATLTVPLEKPSGATRDSAQ